MTQFEHLAHEFATATNPDYKLLVLARALAMPNIRDEVKARSLGWIGEDGDFARVIARMLSQLSGSAFVQMISKLP